MTLPQAIGVILGANIGTTVTSLLLGLPIKEYALPIMAAGSFFIFFVSKKKIKQFGSVMLGFGMLFYGLDLMGDALKALSALPEFRNALLAVSDYPVLGVLVGAGTTATIQSSSATIGILQELYTTGFIPLKGAIAIVFGDNIGTTVTAILAAIGGSVAARRTAAAHVLFNVIGSLVFLIFLVPYTSFIQFLEDTLIDTSNPNNLKMTISFAHMGFNVINTFIMFWFIKQLVWAVTKIIPGDDVIKPVDVDGLQEDLIISSPILALESAKIVVANMGLLTKQMFEGAIRYSFKKDNREFENGMQIEEMLDTIDHKAHDYLVKIARSGLDNESAQSQAEYIDAIRDFERIGDHCTNIFEFFELRYDSKSVLSEEAAGDLGKLYEIVLDSLTKTIEAFRTDDKDLALFIMEQEETIDRLVIKYRKRHIRRVNESEKASNCSVYVDILSNIERIGDHCNNIAKNVVQDQYFSEDYMLSE